MMPRAKTQHDWVTFFALRKTCEYDQCGTSFGPNQYEFRSQKKFERRGYCSKSCAGHAAADRKKAAFRAELSEEQYRKTCGLDGCDVVFEKTQRESVPRFAERRFCTREHSILFARSTVKVAPLEKDCEECHEKMTPDEGERRQRFKDRRFCGDKCRNIARRKKLAQQKPQGWHVKQDEAGKARLSQQRRSPQVSPKKGPAVPEMRVEIGEVWRPAGFPATPNVPDHIRRLNEEHAA